MYGTNVSVSLQHPYEIRHRVCIRFLRHKEGRTCCYMNYHAWLGQEGMSRYNTPCLTLAIHFFNQYVDYRQPFSRPFDHEINHEMKWKGECDLTDVWSFRYIDWIFVSERPIEIICLWHDHTCYIGFTLPLFLSLVINRMHGMVKHTNTSYHYIYILYIDYFRIVLRRNNYDIFYKKNELIFSLFYKTQPRIQ